MTRTLTFGACLVAMAIAACGGGPEAAPEAEAEPMASAVADPTELDVENVSTRLAGGEDIFLLDVRTPRRTGARRGHCGLHPHPDRRTRGPIGGSAP